METNQSNPTGYAARLEIDYPEKLDRLTTFFRIIWIIPIAIIFGLISGAGETVTNTIVLDEAGRVLRTTSETAGGLLNGLVAATILMILFQQRYPRWWFDFSRELTRFDEVGTAGTPRLHWHGERLYLTWTDRRLTRGVRDLRRLPCEPLARPRAALRREEESDDHAKEASNEDPDQEVIKSFVGHASPPLSGADSAPSVSTRMMRSSSASSWKSISIFPLVAVCRTLTFVIRSRLSFRATTLYDFGAIGR